jgi:hypothetical protein
MPLSFSSLFLFFIFEGLYSIHADDHITIL